VHRVVYPQQLQQRFFQLRKRKGVGSVGFCLGRIVVHFHEYSIYPDSNRRPRKDRDEFRLAPTLLVLAIFARACARELTE
jgi:hypothetical protein